MSEVSLLIAMREAHVRLALVDGLRGHYAVHSVADSTMVMVASRQHHPAIILLGVGSRWTVATDLCRRLKTEAGQPPRVGLIDTKGRIQHPEEVARTCLADGVFQSDVTLAAVVGFVGDITTSPPAFVGAPSHRGWIRRWLGR